MLYLQCNPNYKKISGEYINTTALYSPYGKIQNRSSLKIGLTAL